MTVAASPARPARRGVDRPKLYGRAALGALAVAFAFTVIGSGGSDTGSGRLGGDFPAFYAAGSLVSEGDWEHLYDADTQAEAQAALFGNDDGAYLYFAYPPYVAALYRPLAALDYRLAYTVHTLTMMGLLVAALVLARPLIPLLEQRFEAAVTASIFFYPMMRALTGGQNTALTLFLLVAVWRGLSKDDDAMAGLAVAGLLYKPQFALPLLGLLVWQRRPRAVSAAVGGGVALWAAGASVMGSGWVATWVSEVQDFAALDADINGHNAISFLGVAEAFLGSGSTAARVVAAPLMASTVFALLWIWRRSSTLGWPERAALTTVGLVVLSPHAMYYDAGLLVFAGAVALDRLGPRAAPVIAVGAILSWTHAGAEAVGVAPLFFVMVAAGAALAHRAQTGRPQLT
jgi:Glycosyltransferase family 87